MWQRSLAFGPIRRSQNPKSVKRSALTTTSITGTSTPAQRRYPPYPNPQPPYFSVQASLAWSSGAGVNHTPVDSNSAKAVFIGKKKLRGRLTKGEN